MPSNYTEVLTSGDFWRQLGNSVLIAAISTFVGRGPVGAGGVRLRPADRSPAARSLFTFFALGLLFPTAVAILPLYILVRGLGLLDSPLGVALPQAAFQLPLTILILRPFFRSIPVELEDAALIDGCGPVGFFWRVLLPLSRPALATVAVLAVVTSWNAFLLPLVVLVERRPVDAAARGHELHDAVHERHGPDPGVHGRSRWCPALIFYVIAERQLVGGLTVGGGEGMMATHRRPATATRRFRSTRASPTCSRG